MKEKKIPIKTLHLFPVLDKMLIRLLRSLTAEEWNSPTVARLWKVKDIAAHLLDGNMRTISILRDEYFGEQPANIQTYQDLVDFLNSINHSWTTAAKRLSPQLIIQLLESSGKQYYKQLKKLQTYDDAVFSVGWAGQAVSPNWFHIAREYTEKFVHQQQIRDAVGQPTLFTKKLYRPFLDTFMQALPYTYRNTIAATGTIITVIVTGRAGGKWSIIKEENGWAFTSKNKLAPYAVVSVEPEDAWKLFSKSIRPADVRNKVEINGDEALGLVALEMVSVMA